MPEPLWKIRKRKQMSVNQLAAKSGVPAISIIEYESGQTIRSADLPKLAKALYVEELDIELKGAPAPKRQGPPAAAPASAPPAKQPQPRRPATAPARPSQIKHLLTLTTSHFNKERAALEQEVGKSLELLTQHEASKLLNRYQQLLAESRAGDSPDQVRPKRRRAYLPESVDEFELKYLTAQQEAGALLYFTLFDGHKMSGRIVGFGPYSITIREPETEEEVTLQKLAIAYYRRAGGEA